MPSDRVSASGPEEVEGRRAHYLIEAVVQRVGPLGEHRRRVIEGLLQELRRLRFLTCQTLDVGCAVGENSEVVLLPTTERDVPVVLVEVEFDAEFLFSPTGDGRHLLRRRTVQEEAVCVLQNHI